MKAFLFVKLKNATLCILALTIFFKYVNAEASTHANSEAPSQTGFKKNKKTVRWQGYDDFWSKWNGSLELASGANWENGVIPQAEDIALFSKESDQLLIDFGEMTRSSFNIGAFVFEAKHNFRFDISRGNAITFNNGGIDNRGGGDQNFDINQGSTITFNNDSSHELDPSSDFATLLGSNAGTGKITYSLKGNSSTLLFKGSSVTGSNPDSTTINCDLNAQVIFSGNASAEKLKIDANDSTVIFNANREIAAKDSNECKISLRDTVIDARNSKVCFENEASVTDTEINIRSGGSLYLKGGLQSEKMAVTLQSDPNQRASELKLSVNNSISSLDVDKYSEVDLDRFTLTVGRDGVHNQIFGKVIGSKQSKLVKSGIGDLEIGGDYSDFKGTTEVAEGNLVFSKNIDLDRSRIVANGGNIHFADHSSAGSASIEVMENSHLEFKDLASGSRANVKLKANAELLIHQNNSLSSLNTENNTVVKLDRNSLAIGEGKDENSILHGKLTGNSQSKLIKVGAGDLHLKGDISECKGTAEVKEGKLIFENDVQFSEIIADGGTILFGPASVANSRNINALNGGKLELQVMGSKFENSTINCASKAEVEFTGATLARHLKINAHNSLISFDLNEESLPSDSTCNRLSLKDSLINADNSTISFGKKTYVSSTDINIHSGGSLNLFGTLDCEESDKGNRARVTLSSDTEHKRSELKLFADNSIGSLDANYHSKINLDQFVLEVGSNCQDDKILGKVEGTGMSKLVKIGSGDLEMGGDYSSFEGTTVVTAGNFKFCKNVHLDCPIIVADGGNVHFTDSSSAGSSIIDVLGNSSLLFKDTSAGDHAKVTLKSNAEFRIYQDNSLDSLNTDKETVVNLDCNSLTIGKGKDSNSILHGKIIGNSQSKLIKGGSGDLQLKGDISEYKGIATANGGRLIFENIVHFSEIIADGGTILFGENSSANSSKINVLNGGVLEFQKGDSGGKARVELASSGTLKIMADNTLDSLVSNHGSSVYLHNASLTLGNGDHRVMLGGDLHGEEYSQLIKKGKGVLELEGDKSSFAGTTHLQGGTMHFKDRSVILGGNVVVDKETKLKGQGTIAKNLKVKKGGVVDLTGDISLDHKESADLHVKGDFVQEENGEYHLKINDQGKSSLIKVDGIATVDGIMKVDTSEGYVLCTSYKVLEAKGGILGGFQDASVTKGNMKVKIANLREKAIEIRLEPDLVKSARTSNQKNVAYAVENIVNPDRSTVRILDQLVDMSGKEIPKALSQISGEQYGNLILASALSTSRFLRTIYTPIRFISQDHDCDELCYNQCKVWGNVGGGKSCKSGSNGYDLDEFNMAVAFQKSLNGLLIDNCSMGNYVSSYWLTGWTAGIAVGYSNEHYDFNLGGGTDLHNTQGALYALLTKSWYYVLVDIGLGITHGKFKRPIKIKHLHHSAHSDIDIFQATFYGELGLNNICWKTIEIQPYVGFESGSYALSALKEHGAEPLNLKVDGHHSVLSSTYLGVHLYRSLDIDCSWGIAADLAWRYLLGFNDRLTERFALLGKRFEICGEKIGQNAIQGSFSIYKALNDDWMINVELGGEKWGKYSNYELSAGISFTW